MPCNSINSSIEIFALFLLAAMIVAVILKKKKIWQDRLLICALVLHFVNTASDLTTWRVAGKPGDAAFMAAVVGNFCAYLFNALAYFAFLVLIYASLRKRVRPGKLPEWLLAGSITLMTVIMIFITITNHKTGLLYTLTPDNTFSWGPCSVWYDTVILFQFLLLLLLVLLDEGIDYRETVARFLFYAGIPTTAVILQHWYPTLMLLYPTVSISLLVIYMDIQRNQEKELYEKNMELSDTRIRLMLGQIQPHFLYNALLVIQELCVTDPAKAETATIEFSRYLRENLDFLNLDKPILFQKEVEHTTSYLALEQKRYGQKLHIEWDIQANSFLIPAMTLQPIVENAIRYGASKRKDCGTVKISSEETDDSFVVTVSDNGFGFNVSEKMDDGRTHVGISSVRTRLEQMCSGALQIESTQNMGTVVKIVIPKRDKRERLC